MRSDAELSERVALGNNRRDSLEKTANKSYFGEVVK